MLKLIASCPHTALALPLIALRTPINLMEHLVMITTTARTILLAIQMACAQDSTFTVLGFAVIVLWQISRNAISVPKMEQPIVVV